MSELPTYGNQGIWTKELRTPYIFICMSGGIDVVGLTSHILEHKLTLTMSSSIGWSMRAINRLNDVVLGARRRGQGKSY